MKLATVKANNIVEVDHKGRRFMARVEAVSTDKPTVLALKPICREGASINYFSARAHEVVGHYSRRKGSA